MLVVGASGDGYRVHQQQSLLKDRCCSIAHVVWLISKVIELRSQLCVARQLSRSEFALRDSFGVQKCDGRNAFQLVPLPEVIITVIC